MISKKWAASMLCVIFAANAAQATEWRGDWDGDLYGYVDELRPRGDGILNPENRIARFIRHSSRIEMRLNLRAATRDWRLALRPIGALQWDAGKRTEDLYLSRWQLSRPLSQTWHVRAGRELLTWGVAQFRSPANPFYFDNGRSKPTRELTGMDVMTLAWVPNVRGSIAVTRLMGRGHDEEPGAWRNGHLIRGELRGDTWAGGGLWAKQPGEAFFAGLYLQCNFGDEVLLYGEAGSSRPRQTLPSTHDLTQPFVIEDAPTRHGSMLLGAAYTLDNGQNLAVEYLHFGQGFSAAKSAAYAVRASTAPTTAAQAFNEGPLLLNRDYLHLVWQGNPMEAMGYWRLMLSHNLVDSGSEAAVYSEIALGSRASGFALVVLPVGNARQEFSALLTGSLTLGLKLAL